METKPSLSLRLVPWLVLLAVAFAVGRWSRLPPSRTAGSDASITQPSGPAASTDANRDAELRAELQEIFAAARRLLEPDARTLGFFDRLSGPDTVLVAETLLNQRANNERDLLLVLTARRWGELAPQAALARLAQIENFPLRASTTAAAYEAWGRSDAQPAYAQAMAETDDAARTRALAALLPGAAATHPGVAVTLWEGAPAAFRDSPNGRHTLERLAEVACSTGRRDAMQAIVSALPPTEQRARITSAIARHWGAYEPDSAVAWVRESTPAGPLQDSIIDEIFSVFVRKDPVRAAEWARRQADERRRTNYVATAVAEWTAFDTVGAETWVNEQPDGPYLDGATYAIAAHFIERRELNKAFAWTRRIMRNEARAELLGNLGRIWNSERPAEFSTFLAQTSLNRAELEMLRSKVEAPAAP